MTSTNYLTNVILKRTYGGSSLELQINHTTNQFSTNDFTRFLTYLQDNTIEINSHCQVCDTIFVSDILQFDLQKRIICPTKINWECITLDNKNAEYRVETNERETNITISHIVNQVFSAKYFYHLSPLPRSKFKNKQELIEKIETYLLFS